MIGVSIPGISNCDDRRMKIQEQFFYLSLHVLAVKFYIRQQGIVDDLTNDPERLIKLEEIYVKAGTQGMPRPLVAGSR